MLQDDEIGGCLECFSMELVNCWFIWLQSHLLIQGLCMVFEYQATRCQREKYQCCKNSFWGRLEIYGYTRHLSCLLFNVLNIRIQICFLCCKTTVFLFFFFLPHGTDVVKTSSLHFYVFSVILADKTLSLQEGMPILVMEVL